MAMIDYGAIAFKNGKLISTGLFTPQEDTLGFKHEAIDDGQYFVYIGNKDITLGFYKSSMAWWVKKTNGKYESGSEWFDYAQDYEGWKRWTRSLFSTLDDEAYKLDDAWFDIEVRPHNGYYVAHVKDMRNGDQYKVYFGYGVAYRFYKKTRRVNYYSSPEHFFTMLPWNLKHWHPLQDLIFAIKRPFYLAKAKRDRKKIQKEYKAKEEYTMATYSIGQKVHINHISDPYTNYDGREGEITSIDSAGQLHGTWGGCALCAEYGDDFYVIPEPPVATKEAKPFVPSKCMAQKAILATELDAAIQVLENHGGRLGDAKSIQYLVAYRVEDPEDYYELIKVGFKGGAACYRNVTGDSTGSVFREVGKMLYGGYYTEVEWAEGLAASPDFKLLNHREILARAYQADLF